MLAPSVIMMRHGSTGFNTYSGERIRGWRDLPLSPLGQAEILMAGKELRMAKIAQGYSSDLSRAKDTIAAVQREHVKPFDSVPMYELRPWNLGDFTGKILDEVLVEMLKYQTVKADEPVPGGESFNNFMQRFMSFFLPMLADARRYPSLGSILIVAHTRNLRSFDSWIAAGEQGMKVSAATMPETPALEAGQWAEYNYIGGMWKKLSYHATLGHYKPGGS